MLIMAFLLMRRTPTKYPESAELTAKGMSEKASTRKDGAALESFRIATAKYGAPKKSAALATVENRSA